MIGEILTRAAIVLGTAATVHIVVDEIDAAFHGDKGLVGNCGKAWDALTERCKNERMNDWEKSNLIDELYERQSRTIIANETNVYRNLKARTYNTARYNHARITY